MGNKKELNKRKPPVIQIGKSLEKYKNLPLFQDKVDKANENALNDWLA